MSAIRVGPTRVDIVVARNATTVLRVTLTDEAATVVDISADDLEFNVFLPDGTTTVAKTSAAGAHTDGANGIAEFTIAEADWVSFAAGRQSGRYEVRRINVSAQEFVHLAGTITLEPTNL